MKVAVPPLPLYNPLLAKLPDTVSPVAAAADGAVNVPALENEPTVTLFAVQVNPLPLLGMLKALFTVIVWPRLTWLPLFTLIVKLLNMPEAGISNPVG